MQSRVLVVVELDFGFELAVEVVSCFFAFLMWFSAEGEPCQVWRRLQWWFNEGVYM